jgi:RHS repeat-associated protein
MGELTSVIPATPAHGRTTPATTTIGYDAYSRQTSMSDGKGQDTAYSYDVMDRLTKITYDDGSSTTYTYDEDGDRTAAIEKNDSGGTTHTDSYTFDTQDRLSTETNGTNGVETVTYDANSNVITYDDDGGTVTYGYDSASGLTSIAEPGGDCSSYSLPSSPPTLASNCVLFALDKDGNRSETVYPGDNVQQNSTYDADGRISELNATVPASTLYDYTYSYAVGTSDTTELAKISNATDGSFRMYAYDGLERLTIARSVNSAGGITSRNVYCYDKGGNRTSSLTGVSAACPSTPDLTFDGANQALTNTDGTTYTYDLDGNLTNTTPGGTGSGTSYAYNDRNQATTVTTSAGTSTRNYAGPDNNELLSVTAAGSTTSLLNSPQGISALTTGASTTYITRDPGGTIIGTRSAAGGGSGITHRYYLTDERGSVTRVVDPSGTVVSSYSYDPYGNVTTGTPATFGYTGGYVGTGDTSTIKLGQRYYAPTNGTFTQTDPQTSITKPGQFNPYTYAGANPTNNVDPSGQDWFSDITTTVVSGVEDVERTVEPVAAPIALGITAISSAVAIGGGAALALGLIAGVPLIAAGLVYAGVEAYDYYQS